MTLSRYFNLTWTLVSLLALGIAATSGAVDNLALIPVAVITLLALWTKWWRVGVAANGCIALFFLGFGIFEYRENGDLLYIVTYSLAGLLPLAVERRDRPGAFWSALLAHFFLALGSLAAGDTAIEYLLFLAFCSALVFLLNSAHLFFHRGAAEARRVRLPANYFAPFALSVAGGLGLGVAMFVFFPRSLQWQNPLALRQKGGLTGYSGTISLDGGRIRESTALAITVESPDAVFLAGKGPNLHFRANVVDRFDGVNWRTSKSKTVPMFNPSALKWTSVTHPTPRTLRLYRETHSPQAVLYPGVLIKLSAPNRLLGGLRQDELGNLLRAHDEAIRYAYDVTILPLGDTPLITWQEAASAAEKIDPEYRSLPASVKDAAWFKEWLRRSGSAKPTLNAAMGALDAHFQSLFKATYRHEFSPGNTLESFLIKDRTGHCEYFATAAALWLRARGLASRVALGFRGGQYNPISRVLEVREANAHAWVEVYAGPSRGWVLWDPTPIAAPIFPSGVFTKLSEYFAAVRFWFERYVVDYNTSTQRELIKDITELKRWKPGSRPKVDWRWVATVAIAGWAVWRWTRRRRRARRASMLPPYYRAFLAGLSKVGARRARGESFQRFHARLIREGFPKDLVREVDAALENDLYGPPGPRPMRNALSDRIAKTTLERRLAAS